MSPRLSYTGCHAGAQWLSGRVLDSRPKGRWFEPHRRHCVVSLSKNINPSLVLVQPRKTRPYITERLLMGRKESNQIKIKNRLSSESYIHWLYWNSRTWSSSDVIIVIMWNCILAYLGTSGSLKSDEQENESIIRVRVDRRIRPSGSPCVITRQASWCQTAILGTDFSILPSHSWYIYSCEGRIEKSSLGITDCHHSASLVMPNGDTHGRLW